jgi:PAS domain S-box-containing protein
MVLNFMKFRFVTPVLGLIFIMLLVSVLAISVLGYIGAIQGVQNEQKNIQQQQGKVASLVLTDFFKSRQILLEQAAAQVHRSISINTKNDFNIQGTPLLTTISNQPEGADFDYLFFTNAAFDIVEDQSLLLNPNAPPTRKIKSDLTADQMKWHTTLYQNPENGQRITIHSFMTPAISPRTGEVFGYFIGGIILENNFSILTRLTNELNLLGVAIYHDDHLLARSTSPNTLYDRLILGITPHVQNLYRGVSRITVPFMDMPLRLVSIYKAETLTELRSQFKIYVGIALCIACATAIMATILIRGFVARGIDRVMAYANQAREDWSTPLPQEGSIIEFNNLNTNLHNMVSTIADKDAINRAVLTNAAIGIAQCKSDGKITQANPAFARILATDQATAAHVHLSSLLSEADYAHMLSYFADLQAHRRTAAIFTTQLHLPTQTIDVQITSSIVQLKDQGDVSIILLVEDITEKLKKEREKSRLIQIVEAGRDIIATSHEDGKIEYLNTSGMDVLGLQAADDIPKLQHIFQPRKGNTIAQVIWNTFHTGEWFGEMDLITSTGHSIPVSVIMVAHITAHGQKQLSVIARDISQTKRAESLVISQMQELQRINRDLQDYNYLASHDMQEPLRTISTYCDLLQFDLENDPEKAKEDLHFIHDSAKRMRNLVQDLQELNKASQKKLDIKRLDMQKELKYACDEIQDDIKESNAIIDIGDLPYIDADPTLMRILLKNLLTNAIKFCEGTPKIDIFAEVNKKSCVLFVRDNGIGIESEHIEQIFKPFRRLQTIQNISGTGIGLALVQKILDRHYGYVSVDSQIGKGTTFKITLPYAQVIPRDGA